MGEYELYKQRTEQIINTQQNSAWDLEAYKSDKSTRFFENVNKPMEQPQELITRLENRFVDKESFQKRTAYYFDDYEIGELKAKRYKAMADDEDGKVNTFAAAHTNRWAIKRKMNANDAYKNFSTMSKKMASYDRDKIGRDSYEKFLLKEEIMSYRLKGMKAAAVVKSKDSNHETYMKYKSTLSCNLVLLDQLNNMMEKEKNPEVLNKLSKKQTSIRKTIQSTEDSLRKLRVG